MINGGPAVRGLATYFPACVGPRASAVSIDRSGGEPTRAMPGFEATVEMSTPVTIFSAWIDCVAWAERTRTRKCRFKICDLKCRPNSLDLQSIFIPETFLGEL